MTSEDNSTNLPNPPAKLAERIEELPDSVKEGDRIVGNGRFELTSNHPVCAVEYYLGIRADEWSDRSYKDSSYDLTRFLEYCEYAGISDLSELSTSDLEGFKHWRKRDDNVGLASLHGQLSNVRVFIRYCEKLEIVEEGLADEIEMPDLDPSDIVSYVRIESEMAEQILEYHRQRDYVTREFAEFALIWSVLVRLGGARSLDREDYDREERTIEMTHNPEEDTPLKNGENEVEGKGSERIINLPDWSVRS